jgi:RNA polymerase sigma-70 factor (ECF subfamily)
VDFDEFYQASYPRLLRLTVALTASRQGAEDALQEAYTRALVRWHKVRCLDDPEGWVRRVAINQAMDQHRRRARDHRVFSRLRPPPAGPASDASDLPDILKALETLPDKQRRALVLHYLADQSVEQIAAGCGLPVGTVKAQLSRGRAALASKLRSEREADCHAR